MNMKKLRKAALVSAGTMGLLFASAFSSMAADNETTTMAASTYVNVRTQAGMQGKVIGVLSPEEAVQVDGMENGWYRVTYENQKAYVYQEYLKFEGTADGDINNGKKTEMKATVSVNVRADHNNSGNVIGVLAPGEKVAVTGKVSGWYQVDYNGQKGFVYGHYLDFITSDNKSTNAEVTDNEPAHDTSMEGRIMTTTADVNLRTNSHMQARVIKVVPAGAEVTVIDYENGWYRVDYNYDAGCIYGDYLK